MLTIHINKCTLQIAEVSYSGKTSCINKMRQFDLPDDLENGGFTKNTAVSADFIASCIERGKLSKEKALLFLGESFVMHKEYTHESTKPANLLSLACLEADAILPENQGTFIIENEWYGPRKNKAGLQISAIFAINEETVSDLTKLLKEKGIKVIGVFPAAIAHTDLVKKLIGSSIGGTVFADKTVAAIYFSDHETRISIFHNGELIHQRADEQLMEEFFRNVAAAYNISVNEAFDLCLKNGFQPDSGVNREYKDAYDQMQDAGAAMLSKMARFINILLTSEDLKLDHIIISGAPAAIPGFPGLISECFDVRCSTIDDFREELSGDVRLGGELKDRYNLFHRLALLKGIDYKKYKELNFLSKGIKRKKERQKTILVCLFIFIAMVIIMSILPVSYFIANKDYDRNIAMLESPEYMEMQKLLEEQRSVMIQVAAVNEERENLPFGDSHLGQSLEILKKELLAGTSIISMSFDETAKTINAVVSTSDLDSFLTAKNRVNSMEEFDVLPSFAFSKKEGLWNCEISIKLSGYDEMQEGEQR